MEWGAGYRFDSVLYSRVCVLVKMGSQRKASSELWRRQYGVRFGINKMVAATSR